MNIFAQGWSDGYDGPGRRWVIYLKGCNFRCRWCASPESISPKRQLLYYPRRGHDPASACPHGAVGKTLQRDRCARCAEQACAQVYRHPAFQWVGTKLGIEQLVSQAVSSRALFGLRGGVTFGGGEPTLQSDELCGAIAALKQEGIHTAVETNASTPALRQLPGLVDLLICDLKCVTGRLHREWTGMANDIVLENLSYAARHCACDLWIRVPVVPGCNTSDDEWAAITRMLATLTAANSRIRVELLPLHHGAKLKYTALGRQYPMAATPAPAMEHVNALRMRLTETLGRVAVAEQLW